MENRMRNVDEWLVGIWRLWNGATANPPPPRVPIVCDADLFDGLVSNAVCPWQNRVAQSWDLLVPTGALGSMAARSSSIRRLSS